VRSWNKYGGRRRDEPVILKLNPTGSGYNFVMLRENSKRTQRTVHRLVAEAFIPNPDNKSTVNHIDENKFNNCVENLEWATQSENIRHSAAKEIILTKNGVVKHFDCIQDAADFLVLRAPSNLTRLIQGRAKTVYGWAMLK